MSKQIQFEIKRISDFIIAIAVKAWALKFDD